jgi:glycosyltransferase involved in cell wall biosynthesis
MPMKLDLETRYPNMPYNRVHFLPNGYDPNDFDGINPISQQKDKFTIIYSGSFYGQRRTPFYFLKGLCTLIDNKSISRQDLCVRFLGNVGSAVNEQIKRFDLSDIVQLTGYLPHRQSIAHLLVADLLLLVVGSGPGSEVVLTGKIFEYLAAQKTILCLAPPGAAADLVQEAQAGVVVDPEDTEAIASRLASLYRKWKQGELKVNPKPEVIMRYNRQLLTGTLAQLLDEIS